MRRLILCVLLLPCCGCMFVSHQAPLTLGGRWHDQIPPEQESANEDDFVFRAQSAANETQRSLALTLELAELVFVRAPVFVVGAAVLSPLGMYPEMKTEGQPRPVNILTTHSPDGKLYFAATKRVLEPAAKDPTIELTFRIIGPRAPEVHMEQIFHVADDVTFNKAAPEWDFERSLVTITSDNSRRFTLSYEAAVDQRRSN